MAIVDVATSLYEQAKNGNIQAAKFYLKTQAGWREDAPVEVYQPDDDRTWTKELVVPRGVRRQSRWNHQN